MPGSENSTGRVEHDVLVIGAGIAGLTSAIHLADRGKSVAVLNRAFDPEESNTKYAQGGIIWRGEDDDSPALLATDIDAAGDAIGRQRAMEILSQEGPPLVESFLIKRLAVPFDSDTGGHIHRTSEAAHSKSRIIHVKDHTGSAIQEGLVKEAKAHKNIDIFTGHTAVDLVSTTHHSRKRGSAYDRTRILGAYALDRNTGEMKTFLASHTILATGGIGALYRYTTNPEGSRGDGIAMAERAGAHAVNMEYVQFHPTAFRKEAAECFLITEAARGEGGVLVNQKGERFMARYAPERMELAARDEVARAIHQEMQIEGTPNVWLDLSPLARKGIRPEERFPKIFEKCLSYGVDIRKDPIPVSPAAHYLCGGIWVDEWGRTNLQKLYAAGETACTGLHGANRLASTSLLEGLVWGKRVSDDIIANFAPENFEEWQIPAWDESDVVYEKPDEAFLEKSWQSLKSFMWDDVGIVRSGEGLSRAWERIAKMAVEIEGLYRKTKVSDELVGLRNAANAALLVATQALRNKISQGSHFRVEGNF